MLNKKIGKLQHLAVVAKTQSALNATVSNFVSKVQFEKKMYKAKVSF